MYLESDAFAVVYLPRQTTITDIMARIRVLGYRPREAVLPTSDQPEVRSGESIPDPLGERFESAQGDSTELFFIDFYAMWCAPCQVLEKSVLSNPTITKTLSHFEVIKVDTDKFPKAARYYAVKALPTLLIVDGTGAEMYRHLGPISVERLNADLTSIVDTEAGAK
jgi:thiol-disulfide isomerase/thioredoxin